MAGIDDKARFYLERAVPQLREFESKEIFSKEEIQTLVQKRAEFERLVLSPGSTAANFSEYIAWEGSLDRLRRKRCLRLKISQSTSQSSQARTFQLYERAVLRHPESVALWRQYLDFAARVKATKRWRRIMTRALRILPGNSELWVLAGHKAARDGNMETARSMFMRGCRFCTADTLVWLEYARAEMQWLARLEKKKGTAAFAAAAAEMAASATGGDDDGKRESGEGGEEDADGNINFGDEDEGEGDDDFGDMLVLPKSLTDGGVKKPRVFDREAVQKLETSPALGGAIPRAIFDIASKQPFFRARAAEAFFDMFASFPSTAAHGLLVQHVLGLMQERFPQSASTWHCRIRQPLLGVEPDESGFPKALRTTLATMHEGLEKTTEKKLLAAKSLSWVHALLAQEDLDAGIRMVLEDSARRLEKAQED